MLYGQLVGSIASPITGLAAEPQRARSRGLADRAGPGAGQKAESGEIRCGGAGEAPRGRAGGGAAGRGSPAEEPREEAAAEEAAAEEAAAEAPAEEARSRRDRGGGPPRTPSPTTTEETRQADAPASGRRDHD